MSKPTWSVRRVPALDDATIDGLADVLIDCVDGGASVSFMQPLTRDRAVAFWSGVAEGVRTGERAVLVAEDSAGICGTVQLVLHQPENQPHRADLAKMLVHHRVRRQGLGAALMRAAEETARECGKTLLVLDAVTGGDAERLYQGLGWRRVGVIPGYALFPQGGLCDTTYYYRILTSGMEPACTSDGDTQRDDVAWREREGLVWSTSDSVRSCEDALRRAQLMSDVAMLDRLVDETLVFIGPDGSVFGKSDDLDAHRNGWVRITRLEPSDERVREFEDIAVVSVRMEMAGTFRGTPFAGPFRYTRVWHRRPDGWRIVSGHVSPIVA